jgi:hypothetical protein
MPLVIWPMAAILADTPHALWAAIPCWLSTLCGPVLETDLREADASYLFYRSNRAGFADGPLKMWRIMPDPCNHDFYKAIKNNGLT